LLEAALPDQLPKRYRAEPAFWEDKKQRYLNKAVFYMERVRKQMQDDTK
jgi:hypothetical protein